MAKDLMNIHDESRIAFSAVQEVAREEREQSLEDRRFCYIAGAMWEGKYLEQFKNKPRLELNKILLAVQRVINEYRNNRITVNFVSKDGSDDDKLADTCDMLYRSDERYSCAQEAYDTAFDEAVTGGIGAWRLRSEYEDEYDEDNDHQRILFEPITDSDLRVFFDLGAKRQDKSDAKKAWILHPIPRMQYIEEYDDDPATWPQDINTQQFDWAEPDVVYVAEYYEVEEAYEKVFTYRHIDGSEEKFCERDFELDDDLEMELLAKVSELVNERKIKRKKVHKYLMSGSKILEDCGYIAGTEIPIAVNYGRRNYIENIERFSGLVRFAKDAQRVINAQYSKLLEVSSHSPIEKPIIPWEMISRHKNVWAEDNLKNFPFLPIDPLTDQNGQIVATAPSAYTKPPQVPPALAALIQLSETDIKDILGDQQQAEKLVSNISGDAVDMIQTQISQQSHIYMDNMAKAMKRCGEIWLSMARDIYVEPGRKMKGIGQQEEVTTLELMRPVSNKGVTEYENDFKNAKFDVAVEVGPASSSKKRATVKALTGMMQISSDPETMQVLGAMAMMNMEGEGIDDVRQYYRKKLIRMGVVKPTMEEGQELMEELQNTPQDPQAQYLESAAQNEQAKAMKAQADTAKALANAQKIEAETVQILSETDENSRKSAIEAAQALQGAVTTGTATPFQAGE